MLYDIKITREQAKAIVEHTEDTDTDILISYDRFGTLTIGQGDYRAKIMVDGTVEEED